MKIRQIARVTMLLCSLCVGQSGSVRPITNIPDAEFPRINSDLSATFRVQAEQAHKVQLVLEFGQTTFDMVKGEDEFWSVTTKPLLPGFHYYGIAVDGFLANDPEAEYFSLPGKKSADWRFPASTPAPLRSKMFPTVRYVPSGMFRKRQVRHDESSSIRRRDTIKAAYTTRSFIFSTVMERTKPVGVTRDTRTSFLVNLIAAHKTKPMIIVNENGLPGPGFQPPPPPPVGSKPTPIGQVARYFMDERYETFDRIISSDLISFIDANFRTVADREHRAIAGLSMGGAQALRIGLHHLNQFAYIGAFSPAIDITDSKKDYDGGLANPTRLNQQLRLLWIGIGADDFLFVPVKESHTTLEKAGVTHVWVESSGAHVWTVWRNYLADFAPMLFQ